MNRIRSFILFLLIFSSCRDDSHDVFYEFESDLNLQISSVTNIYDPGIIELIMKKVCSWQLLNPVEMNDGNGMTWARAAFYPGVIETYYVCREEKYLDAAIRWAARQDWKMGERYDHPDDHSIGQTYLELYFLKTKEGMIRDVIATFDRLIEENPEGRELYWWADALFMSPTVLVRLYQATKNDKYLNALNAWWWDSYDLLYDPAEHLFYQSHWFFNKKTPNGFKTFWARANGWVMAATVTILNYLPEENPYYQRYVDLHVSMCEKIVHLQQDDGLWRPSLLDSLEVPIPEASSTGFFTYALAWGINHGILDRNKYLPAVKKAWKGLIISIHETGKLGWVQPGGSKPDEFEFDDFQEYGAGAFLLAASEVHELRIDDE